MGNLVEDRTWEGDSRDAADNGFDCFCTNADCASSMISFELVDSEGHARNGDGYATVLDRLFIILKLPMPCKQPLRHAKNLPVVIERRPLPLRARKSPLRLVSVGIVAKVETVGTIPRICESVPNRKTLRAACFRHRSLPQRAAVNLRVVGARNWDRKMRNTEDDANVENGGRPRRLGRRSL